MRLFAFALYALAASPAFAAGATDGLIGNTLTLTDSNGAATAYKFTADGAFTRVSPSGSEDGGAWATEGERLCLMPTGGAKYCLPWAEDRAVGDVWEVKGPTGAVAFTAAIE